jgi:hypothetical protein
MWNYNNTAGGVSKTIVQLFIGKAELVRDYTVQT